MSIIWSPFERILWGIAITVTFITGFQYFRKGRQKEEFNDRILMYGFASFLLGLTFRLIFYAIFENLLQGTYINGIFYGNFPETFEEMPDLNQIVYHIANLSYTFGTLFFFLALETNVKRSKYLLSIINFCFIVLYTVSIFLRLFDFMDLITIIYNVIYSIMLLLICYYVTKWSKLEFKAIMSLFYFGFMLFTMGFEFNIYGKQFGLIPLFIPPIVVSIGSLIFLFPIIVESKLIANALKYWKIVGILIFSILILGTFFSLTILINYSSIYTDIALIYEYLMIAFRIIAFILISYLVIKNIKFEAILVDKEAIKDLTPNILEIFAKPQRITEEEVSISKEKKICLVCKGNLARSNIYLCPDCNAFYCQKCSETLSNMENACWVCDTPFDESKPSKPYEPTEVEEKISVEESERSDFIYKS